MPECNAYVERQLDWFRSLLRLPFTRAVLLVAFSLILVGCIEDENAPRAALTIVNETESSLVLLSTSPDSTPEERFASGFPRNRALNAGGTTSRAIAPVDRDYDQRPLCQVTNLHFYALVNPDMEWEPWNDPSQGFDDLRLVDVLEEPCWDSDSPTYRVQG